MATPAPGPLEPDRKKAGNDALKLARVRVREARLSGDPGFYTLAETALDCALLRSPADIEARRLKVHLLIQFHRFAEAETAARALESGPVADANFLDYALLGDALMEQGKLDAAGDAYQTAVNIRPGLEMYDRIAWLRWLWGDVDGALAMQQLAVDAGSRSDPEPLAWVLTRMGWLHALTGKPAPEIDEALALLPDYPAARFARGRTRLASGDLAGAMADFKAVGPTVEATRARAEAGDPTANVDAVGAQDPRGYAIWLATRADPGGRSRSVSLLSDELKNRQDAVTRMALAYARFTTAGPAQDAEVNAILATGIVEPRALLQAGLVLRQSSPAAAKTLLDRALKSGPGLLPSEQAQARASQAAP